MDNQEILALFNQWAEKRGIVSKAEGGVLDLTTMNFGGLLPREVVEDLIVLTRKQSDWLATLDTKVRTQAAGTVPIFDLNEPVTEYVGEHAPTPITTRPTSAVAPYSCKKFRSDLYITTEDLREAVAAGIPNFEQKLTESWAIQLGNDVADIVINGDKTLDSLTRRNRLRRGIDGLAKQSDAGNIYNALGQAWGQGIFAAMLDKMPDRFANDPNLRWLFNRRLNINWHASLTNVNTTERMRSGLGDQVISTPINVPPLGVSQLIVPQISSNEGISAAPDTITDNTTYLTARVNSILVDTTDSTGRKVKITYKPTGLSEICTVVYVSTENTILTVGLLGQTTVDTAAANYVVQIYDETHLYLMNPKSLTLVYCSEWRSYREFNKDYDRFEITTYLELDVLLPTADAVVKFKRVLVAPITSWS